MRHIILSMHTSLDGFVAGDQGEMDWIRIDDELFDHIGKLTDQADTAMYGRITWQMMDSYWPKAANKPDASKHDMKHSQWYNTVSKVVISKTLMNEHIANTMIIGHNMVEQIQKLKQQPGKSILIFGSPSASHSLMHHNLIDEYRLLVNPILIGSGIPLFNNINKKINLKFIESKVFSSGVIELHYERKS